MKRLVDVQVGLAHQILDRLAAASIKASSTTQIGSHGAGDLTGLVTVWVDDDCDPVVARTVLTEFLVHLKSTKSQFFCERCGYDLRGHEGPSKCPECGSKIVAPALNIPCPQCAEQVPSSFDVCWNCGGSLTQPRRSGDT